MRKAPLGIILNGVPGIGKTDVINTLRLALSEPLGYSQDQDVVFIAEGELDHYNGYKENKAVVILDDAAFKKFNENNPDTGVEHAIKWKNNVPFNMPMADLADKGKTPFRPSLLLITTNVYDLNIPYIFAASKAVMRRFIHLTAELKDEYKDCKGLLKPDPQMMGSNEQFPPYWRFVFISFDSSYCSLS